ncbi:MAG: hypothetical protein K6G45_08420 [Lachnospiraceae bacterium]|nr:hypothetical protein [Lachnospiraceae bacterium]
MSTIRDISGNNNYFDDSFNKINNNNSFLSGLNINTDSGNTFNVSDYAMIKNGSYTKLLKAYYAQEKAQKTTGAGDSQPKLTLMAGSAGAMAKSASVLTQNSLWEKKIFTDKDEETGEEVKRTDYDWNAITKAVKAFVEDYNSTVDGAGESNTKDVLRHGAWMTKTTSKNEGMLGKVGISIGKGNKLELDEEKLKNANIADLRTMFVGRGSYADQMTSKGNSIANAAARAGGAYTNKGSYSSVLSQLVSGKIDTKE